MKNPLKKFQKIDLLCIFVLVCICSWILFSVITRKKTDDIFPSKHIDIICPFSAGGGTDLLCRTIADSMSQEFKVPVNVQNITGGGGALGHTHGVEVSPDGYTLTMITFELITLSQRGFAPIKIDDFDYVARLNADAACVAVNKDFPADTFEDFLKLAKTKKLKAGNSGVGSVWHLASELFSKKVNIEMSCVAFDGASNAITAMLGKHIDLVTVSAAELKAHVESGKVKILAVMADKRISYLPNVPTCKERGVDVSFCTWRGITLPKNVPQRNKDILQKTIAKILASKKMREFSNDTGIDIEYCDGKFFKEKIIEQYYQIKPLMIELGLMKEK